MNGKNRMNVEKVNSLNGKKNYEITIATKPFYQYKEKITDPNYHFKHEGKDREYGVKSKGIDVAVWLDDKLIYEKKNGKLAAYYNGATNAFKKF